MYWLLQQKFNQMHAPADDDGSQGGSGQQGGGGEGGNSDLDPNDPKIQALIDAKVKEATSGLTAKRDELLGKLTGLKNELKNYEGIDPEKVRNLMNKLETDEERDLIGQGQFETVFERRTEKMQKAHLKALEEKDGELGKANERIARLTESSIASAIKGAAAEAGALPKALSDFVSRAKGVFTLNDDLQVVAVDSEGNVLYDADGKTPLSPIAWAKSLREEAPHLFSVPSGGGSQGGQGQHTAGSLTGDKAEREQYFATKYKLPIA